MLVMIQFVYMQRKPPDPAVNRSRAKRVTGDALRLSASPPWATTRLQEISKLCSIENLTKNEVLTKRSQLFLRKL